jgi:S-adenosylmethionine hydrolase
MVAIDLRNAPELTSARDVFARVAAHLARGGKIDLLGREIQEMKQSLLPQPVIRENGKYLIGSVIYVDRFGNLVTNLHQKQVAEVE